jgi:2-methylisocitrate lyase-like PEP mutase family enzyme
MKKTTLLRKLLKEQGVLVVPSAYDCLSAKIIETVGFKAFFMPPTMVGETQLGMPNIGLATSSEVINCAKYMALSVDIPLIMGADDGYGCALAAYRTTQEVIRAGVAGMYISDRTHHLFARTPHNLVEVLSRNEYIGKMGAVIEARNKLDKDFIVAARIDAGATMGYEEVIARAKACVKLGVDVILPHAVPSESKFGQKDKENLRIYYREIGAPEVTIWWGMEPQGFTAADCQDVGAKIWVPYDPPTDAVKKALFGVYREVYDSGNYPANRGVLSSNQSQLDFWCELEKKYVPLQSL